MYFAMCTSRAPIQADMMMSFGAAAPGPPGPTAAADPDDGSKTRTSGERVVMKESAVGRSAAVVVDAMLKGPSVADRARGSDENFRLSRSHLVAGEAQVLSSTRRMSRKHELELWTRQAWPQRLRDGHDQPS